MVVAPLLTLPAPTAAAAPLPPVPDAEVNATAWARDVPKPGVDAAELPKLVADGLPAPAEVETVAPLLVLDAVPPPMVVVTPLLAAVGAGPTVGRLPA